MTIMSLITAFKDNWRFNYVVVDGWWEQVLACATCRDGRCYLTVKGRADEALTELNRQIVEHERGDL